MALNQTNPKFPAPNLNKCEADDPFMIRVKTTHSDIGARTSGMPKGIDNLAPLEHVGGKDGS